MLFKQVVDAFVASREWDASSLGRLEYWAECFGDREFAALTVDDVDAALMRLAERGRLLAGRRSTKRSGRPLKGATINRYQSTLGSIYKFARRARLVPRNFVTPTHGIEKLPEPLAYDAWPPHLWLLLRNPPAHGHDGLAVRELLCAGSGRSTHRRSRPWVWSWSLPSEIPY